MALVQSLQAGSQFGNYTFSHDSKYLLCCCGNLVKVFNSTNGECLHDLRAHSKPVTGIAINPSNVLQAISCGQDGLLVYWDYLDGVRLKQHNLHIPLHGILLVNAEKKSIIMLAQTSEHKKTFSLMQWKRKKSDPNEFMKPKMLIQNCDGDRRLVSFGCSKEYMASGLKHELAIFSTKKESIKYVSDNDKFNKHKAITCVACHPTEYCIATGLENGKIILWHNFFKDTQPVLSTMHWHALPVLCLDFTPDGSNLLSGGNECVLVRWQMGNQNQRDFKPRMGAPLTHVLCSPDGNLYATKHSDNVIQLLDINLKILQVYRGMTQNIFGVSEGGNPIPSGLRFDPRSRTLVTNGLPGHLQFYSLKLGKQLFNLDIVGQNYISPENMDRPKCVTEITCTAISNDGGWLATFESWDDGFFTPEMRLKFWAYTSESQTYSLNTTVEYPHDKKITSMLFRPPPSDTLSKNSPMLVTLGADLCFKAWTLVDDTDIYRTNTRWNCDSVGFYRGLEITCADFSSDASTLAVGCDHLLTIWDPDNNVVRASLSNSLPEKEVIKYVKFGSHQSCHQLVCATSHSLVSWDLLTLSIMWTTRVEASLLIKDPASDLMAYISRHRTVCIFRPSSAELIYQHDDTSSSDIVDCVFVPEGRHEGIKDIGWPGSSQIYFYNVEQQLITLDLPSHMIDENKVKVAQHLPPSTLSTIMAERLVREHGGQKVQVDMGHGKLSDDSFISQLLHSNEPVSMHCDKYLSSLLVKKKARKGLKSQDQEAGTYGLQEKSDEDTSSSESEPETDEIRPGDLSNPKKTVKDIHDGTGASSQKDMNRLLAQPLDWVKWCADLHLK